LQTDWNFSIFFCNDPAIPFHDSPVGPGSVAFGGAGERRDLSGHADIPHGISSGGFKYSSCWGWVSPDGREYALIGAYDGLSIVDLNGDSLRELQFIPGPPSVWHENENLGKYAYCVSEGGWECRLSISPAFPTRPSW